MQSHVRAVVIGGGCVGVGVLYGLARRGWRDVALLERTQLTAGSTWHAAGLIPSYARNRNIGRMIQKSIEIYEGLEAETGLPVGWHKCGQLRIAKSRDRFDEYKSYMDTFQTQGIRAELVSPQRALEIWPLLQDDGMLGALYHPDDGHIAPADVTMAMAKGARDKGASIHLNTEVKAITRQRNGEWKINTSKGDITCEHVVLATGNYARQTGRMVGLEIPAIPILHQYWVTETVPEIVAHREASMPEMPIMRDEAIEGYIREEGAGFMFGPYERPDQLELFAVDGVPEWFGADLVEEKMEAVERNWEQAVRLVPALGRAGIKANVRGPFQMTADELPLMGKAWGLDNLWLAEGVPGGILWGGAMGFYLSQQIVEGGNDIDTSDLDPRRFGDYVTKEWTRLKSIEAWGTHAEQHYPGEEQVSARPQKTAPSYDLLTAHGAVWGVLNGWEVPNWYARDGIAQAPQVSWRWTEKGRLVGEEAMAVRQAVGLVEMSCMTKFEAQGPGAARWLDRILASKLPKLDRAVLAHQLTPRGTVLAEYVVARLAEDHFYLISTPRAERYNYDELRRVLPADGSVVLRNVSAERGAFTVVGPKAREVLQPLTDLDLSNAGLPWFGVRTASFALAPDVRILRLNYEGELGYELYVPMPYVRHVLEELLRAGGPQGLRLVGMHALEGLRLEKSYRAMFRDMNMELTAWESRLDRFVALDKGDFVGRDALLEQKGAGVARRSVTLKIKADGASAFQHEGLYWAGKLVGRITSGSYSYALGCDLAIALVDVPFDAVGETFDLTILGVPHRAEVVTESPYDPDNTRIRG